MKVKRSFAILSLVLMLLTAASVNGAIINVPDDQGTIQAGITAAGVGDTVLIQPGTYQENRVEINKVVTVGSLFLTTGDPAYIASTIVDGNADGKIFYLNTVPFGGRVSGLTVQNGHSADGAGFYIALGAPKVDHCVIQSNVSTHFGGGISSYGSDLRVSNCTFINNHSDADGGGLAVQNSTGHMVSMDSCIFVGNSAT